MFDLESFEFTQMIKLGAGLRNLADGAKTMEAVATRIVHYFYDSFAFRDTGQKACVLVRLFKTHAFGDLDERLRQSAEAKLGGASPSPSMKSLILLGPAREKTERDFRAQAVG